MVEEEKRYYREQVDPIASVSLGMLMLRLMTHFGRVNVGHLLVFTMPYYRDSLILS